MTAAIPPEFEQFVAGQIAAGQYASSDEVVGAGLRVLQELTRRQEELRRDVQAGLDQLERGEAIHVERDALRAFFDDVQQRGRDRYEAAKQRP